MSNCKILKGIGFVLLSVLFMTSSMGYGDAVILMSRGENEIFTNPSASSDSSAEVIFNGKRYTAVKAKIGRRVHKGDVIKTSNNGFVRIGFSSGDSMNIGPASAMVLNLPVEDRPSSERKGLAPTLNLLSVKVRAVISKKGPLNHVRVKTQAAVAGVRGTDFYVAFNPSIGKMVTAVFRGAVEVTQPESQQVLGTVKPGFLIEVRKGEKKAEKPRLSTKEELKEVHEISKVGLSKKEYQQLAPETQELVKKTELSCQKAIFEDIQAANPALAEEIQKRKIKTARAMNAMSLNRVYKEAPSDPKRKGKLSEEEMKKLIDDDVYEEYYQ